MDLDSYIGRYSGETRLKRLLLIAETTADDALANRAFDMVEQQLRRDGNVQRYKEIFGDGGGDVVGLSSGGELPTTSATGGPTAASASRDRASSPLSSSSSGGIDTAEQPIIVDMTSASAAPAPAPTPHGPAGRLGINATVRRRRPNRTLDLEWIAMTESANFSARQALTGRLSSAQSHLHKEAIRTAYLALAEHDLQTGSRAQGMANLMRSMDYCTTRTQTAQISVVILEVAFGLEDYSQVRDYVNKVKHTVRASSTGAMAMASSGGTGPLGSHSNDIMQDVAIKLEIASGIERMVAGEYARAARILIPLVLNTSKSTNDTTNTGGTNALNNDQGDGRNPLDWPGVTSPEDLALYASIMGLVTQNREQILQLAEHPDALELVPAVKDLLLQWSRSNYIKCIQAFAPAPTSNDAVMATSDSTSFLPMGVDIYLSSTRWNDLARKVRESCLVEYLKPYQCVRLESMQQLFPSLGPNVVDVLLDLMARGLLPRTRLDCRAGILFKIPPRKDPARQLQVMEEKIMDDVHALLVRLACLDADLCVQDPDSSSSRFGGPRGRSAGGRRTGPAGIGGGGFIEAVGGSVDSSDDENNDDHVIMRVEEPDTHMIDADAAAAMNPEDRY